MRHREITTVRLFNKLEQLRAQTTVTIAEAAWIVNVVPFTYKKWKHDRNIPNAKLEPNLRVAVEVLTAALDRKLLPVEDPRSIQAIDYRRSLLQSLVHEIDQ